LTAWMTHRRVVLMLLLLLLLLLLLRLPRWEAEAAKAMIYKALKS